MSNRTRKSKYDNVKKLNESLNSSNSLNEACVNAGNNCTAAISCGGENSYHGTVTLACTCSTSMGDFGSGWLDCGPSEGVSSSGMLDIDNERGGDLPMLNPQSGGKTRTTNIKSVDEGCGCDQTNPTDDHEEESFNETNGFDTEDDFEVIGEWVDNHLVGIENSVKLSEGYEDDIDSKIIDIIGQKDFDKVTEYPTEWSLEGSTLPDHYYDEDYELDSDDVSDVFDASIKATNKARYIVDVHYDVNVPSSGDPKKDKILAEKVTKADMRNLKNMEYWIGDIDLRGHY
tara:strand:+ start:26804 stop:27664 length:861 start_codon:yes stop_codon:yes gene_type:complete